MAVNSLLGKRSYSLIAKHQGLEIRQVDGIDNVENDLIR